MQKSEEKIKPWIPATFSPTRNPTESELQTLKTMAAAGETTFAIAKRIGTISAIITRWAQQNNVTIQPYERCRILTPDEVQQLKDLVTAGHGITHITKELKTSFAVVQRALDAHELKPCDRFMRQIVLTPEQRRQVRKLFKTGQSVYSIALQIGIGETTMQQKIQQMGLTRPAILSRQITEVEKEQLRKCITEGRSQTYISRTMGASVPVIRRWLKELDLSLEAHPIPPFIPTPEEAEIIDKMISERQSIRAIASKLGVSFATLSNYFRRENIERPRKAKERSVSAPPKAKPKSNPAPRTPKPKPAREITEKDMGLAKGEKHVSIAQRFRVLGQKTGAELVTRRA
jgi:DNA invertase Pin-like site-specific DNA recombinase